ncbi:hypothetical protein POSPLDRAFT_94633 [Postia placenta Mad-698-R]|nr:hypothetical protein POSPLDRAFT_94633 [Postia placenta Mad-698-R]
MPKENLEGPTLSIGSDALVTNVSTYFGYLFESRGAAFRRRRSANIEPSRRAYAASPADSSAILTDSRACGFPAEIPSHENQDAARGTPYEEAMCSHGSADGVEDDDPEENPEHEAVDAVNVAQERKTDGFSQTTLPHLLTVSVDRSTIVLCEWGVWAFLGFSDEEGGPLPRDLVLDRCKTAAAASPPVMKQTLMSKTVLPYAHLLQYRISAAEFNGRFEWAIHSEGRRQKPPSICAQCQTLALTGRGGRGGGKKVNRDTRPRAIGSSPVGLLMTRSRLLTWALSPICQAPLAVHGELGEEAAWSRALSSIVTCRLELIERAEQMGTFLYTFAGVGSTAGWVLGNILGLPSISSGCILSLNVTHRPTLLLVSRTPSESYWHLLSAWSVTPLWIYVQGRPTCSQPASKGHVNPAFTVYALVRGHCTPQRALMLIVAQILGAYIACLLIYAQYHTIIQEATEALMAKGVYDEIMFTSQGPGGIFGLYATPGASLGNIFVNEFVCDFILAVCVFGAIEPTNPFSPPTMAPWIIAFTYAIVIWGYAPVGLAANSARDVGGRLAALTLWGLPASGGRYAAIAALTNIPATLLAGVFYEFVLNDSNRMLTPAYLEVAAAERAHEERVQGVAPSDASLSSGDSKAPVLPQ